MERLFIGLLTLYCISGDPGMIRGDPPPPSSTFRTCNLTAEKHWSLSRPIAEQTSPSDQIRQLPIFVNNNLTEILQLSPLPDNTVVSKNGFVNTVIEAYSNHNNLVIRPDDIWAAIMTQFSFYVNNNSEELRKKFVNFDGKKKLSVVLQGSMRSTNYETFVSLMSEKIDENLQDKQVKDWVLPGFSTTTPTDKITVGVVLMATLKNYFEYEAVLMCGIPVISLQGYASDWANILGRLEKLKEYGLTKWYNMLEPILQQFLATSRGKPDLDFWQKIVTKQSLGSGMNYISGWITAFAVCDKDGNWINEEVAEGDLYPRLSISKIPTGIVEVDVSINDNGAKYNSTMIAGHLGMDIVNGGDTVQPKLGWLIALKDSS